MSYLIDQLITKGVSLILWSSLIVALLFFLDLNKAGGLLTPCDVSSMFKMVQFQKKKVVAPNPDYEIPWLFSQKNALLLWWVVHIWWFLQIGVPPHHPF